MEDTVFCGVFDGHGPFGHLVARRVRDSIPSKLVHYWEEELAHSEEHEQGRVGETLNSRGNGQQNGTSGMNGEYAHREEEATESGWQDGMAKEHPMFQPWKESHLTAYRIMDKELRAHPGIDCFCSGTTAVTVLKQASSSQHPLLPAISKFLELQIFQMCLPSIVRFSQCWHHMQMQHPITSSILDEKLRFFTIF